MADYLPVKKIANGCVYTSDHRYVRILEISPINFSLRSQFEQRNIIYSFIGYLKISPAKVHIKVITKRRTSIATWKLYTKKWRPKRMNAAGNCSGTMRR